MPFKDTPCATCRPSEPERAVNNGAQFEHPTDQTWKILEFPEEERRTETFKYWLDAWLTIAACDQRIIAFIVLNPGASQSELARRSGVSRQAIHKKVRRLRERFPGVFV